MIATVSCNLPDALRESGVRLGTREGSEAEFVAVLAAIFVSAGRLASSAGCSRYHPLSVLLDEAHDALPVFGAYRGDLLDALTVDDREEDE